MKGEAVVYRDRAAGGFNFFGESLREKNGSTQGGKKERETGKVRSVHNGTAN